MDDDFFMDDLWAEFEEPFDEELGFYEEDEMQYPEDEIKRDPIMEETHNSAKKDRETDSSRKKDSNEKDSQIKDRKKESNEEHVREDDPMEDTSEFIDEEYIEEETPEFQAAKNKSKKDDKNKQKNAVPPPNTQSPAQTMAPLTEQKVSSSNVVTGSIPIATVTATVTSENLWPPAGGQPPTAGIQNVGSNPYDDLSGIGQIGVYTSNSLPRVQFINLHTIIFFILLVSIFQIRK